MKLGPLSQSNDGGRRWFAHAAAEGLNTLQFTILGTRPWGFVESGVGVSDVMPSLTCRVGE